MVSHRLFHLGVNTPPKHFTAVASKPVTEVISIDAVPNESKLTVLLISARKSVEYFSWITADQSKKQISTFNF